MKLENQVSSLELSKRLKELGVKQESYFRWIDGDVWDATMCSDYETTATPHRDTWVSAFTVAELGEMLQTSGYDLPWVVDENTWWWSVLEEDESASSEADARAKMLIYLLENKLITI